MLTASSTSVREVSVNVGGTTLRANLCVPPAAIALVVFAHGSGSSRLSTRNQAVARAFHRAGIATLLLDLLTDDEEEADRRGTEFRFDIPRLAERLVGAVDWATRDADTRTLPICLFGASTGAAAALVAAANRPELVHAVVSRGGRPDLAGEALREVRAPTLLIVGSRDTVVVTLNEIAMRELGGPVKLELVPGATHLFEEVGALDDVADRAVAWILRYAGGAPVPAG